jgi:hypothetical protein
VCGHRDKEYEIWVITERDILAIRKVHKLYLKVEVFGGGWNGFFGSEIAELFIRRVRFRDLHI